MYYQRHPAVVHTTLASLCERYSVPGRHAVAAPPETLPLLVQSRNRRHAYAVGSQLSRPRLWVERGFGYTRHGFPRRSSL
ncbi:hypothetical protein CH063_02762 [Colletotrichum higginsianum]|uniref:Uncharacterized protein n=1 Tax=Colletotrichum higginsianum (strain IMI 349063) TaxID=759273 RepID=H1VPI4_COLHI|nr:hypothetical protein CH063_02762 [Colletotrichum higginsianum]